LGAVDKQTQEKKKIKRLSLNKRPFICFIFVKQKIYHDLLEKFGCNTREKKRKNMKDNLLAA
jgi:hypothetical protein